jgi:hypothetical protein
MIVSPCRLALDRHEVPDLQDHAPCGRRVGEFHSVPNSPEAHAFDHQLLLLVEADRTLDEPDLEPLCLRH